MDADLFTDLTYMIYIARVAALGSVQSAYFFARDHIE